MILVADASALIALSACNGLPLLDAIFGQVMVPEAVFTEVTQADKPQSDRLRVVRARLARAHSCWMTRWFAYMRWQALAAMNSMSMLQS